MPLLRNMNGKDEVMGSILWMCSAATIFKNWKSNVYFHDELIAAVGLAADWSRIHKQVHESRTHDERGMWHLMFNMTALERLGCT
ncbi:hypothetical protein AVEN_125991-1 [Araneus ventricosus]|uniref:Uncharacterized protein n=1 Tax=Araneus ventricosus TaxID=182803 RepID=A0A4Y2PTR9_ARAVE|nr:hypothetical protein AVEN_125991-1 [Araneus ventricosus]